MSSDQSPIILAFSGGLDTSFCVPWLKETYGREVITACVDTGGIDAEAAANLEQRALALGAIEHVLLDAKEAFYKNVIRYLVAGNVLRGNAYPLCVGAERGHLPRVREKKGDILRAAGGPFHFLCSRTVDRWSSRRTTRETLWRTSTR